MHFGLFNHLNERYRADPEVGANTWVVEIEDENPIVSLIYWVVIQMKSILFFDSDYYVPNGSCLSKAYP